MYRRIARIGMTVVLLLATQFAVAGQLCNSVMARGMMDGHPVQQHEGMRPDAVASMEAPPCCDGSPMSTGTCVAAVDGPGPVAFAPHGLTATAAAPPPAHASMMNAGHRPAPALRPVTLTRAPLPAYILLQRFLS